MSSAYRESYNVCFNTEFPENPLPNSSGKLNDSVTWEYNNGILTFSGTGSTGYCDPPAGDMFFAERPWSYYFDEIRKIVVSEGITEVGAFLFTNCGSVENIYLPKSFNRIGDEESWLEYIGVSKFVVSPENRYFSSNESGCLFDKNQTKLIAVPNNMEECFLPSTVNNIGEHAFKKESKVKKILVDVNNQCYTSDSNGVLYNKDKSVLIKYPAGKEQEEYSIPANVHTIEEYAFYITKHLQKIVVSDGVKTIKQRAFYGNLELQYVELSKTVSEIDQSAFANCEKLTEVIILNKDANVGSYAFGKRDNLTIYGYSGSTAETYATENNINFVSLGAPPYTPGELNSDGEVDMNDAILLLQYSMFPELYPLEYTGNVDFTGDGFVDMNDAILLLQHSMFPDLYPIE